MPDTPFLCENCEQRPAVEFCPCGRCSLSVCIRCAKMVRATMRRHAVTKLTRAVSR